MPGLLPLDELAIQVLLTLLGLRGIALTAPVGPSLGCAYWIWQVWGSFGWIVGLGVHSYDMYSRSELDHRRPDTKEQVEKEDDRTVWRLVGQAGNGRRPTQQRQPRPPVRPSRAPVDTQGITVSPNNRERLRYYAWCDA